MPRTKRAARHPARNSPYTPCESTFTNIARASPYAPIDSENGNIRLLELTPGKFEDVIVMRLIPHNLTADAQFHTYAALSYAWGTEKSPDKAILNGIPVEITSNLDYALRHLRFTLNTRTLWIDAVSMNQADTQERNHQVQIMGKIYSTAREVIVWLGPVDQGDLHMRAVLGAMQFHFSDGHPLTTTLFDYVCSVIALMNEKTVNSKDAKDCVLDALHRLVDPTDPRDKVFSILGISCFPNKDIKPDYTKSVQRVFSEAATALLEDKYLALYLHAPLLSLRESPHLTPLPGLPSWVPGLRIQGAAYAGKAWLNEYPRLAYHRPIDILPGPATPEATLTKDLLDDMCHRMPIKPATISPDLNRLYTPGVLIGTIEVIYVDPFDPLARSFLLSGLPESIYQLYWSTVQPRGVTLLAFVRTLTQPHVLCATDNEIKAISLLFDRGFHPKSVSKRVWNIMQNICSAILAGTATRSLFVTHNTIGRIYHPDPIHGLRIGDEIVGLFGVNFPFVLRQIQDDTYRMINVAGVAGHVWGHDFLHNTEEDLATFTRSTDVTPYTASSSSWKDYEPNDMEEYIIV